MKDLQDAKDIMGEARKQGATTWTAQRMLEDASLTDEAREWLKQEFDQRRANQQLRDERK